MDQKFQPGQAVIYTLPVKGKRFESEKEKKAIVLREWPTRVEISVEFKPGVHLTKMVSKDSVRSEHG